jgi:hypothetical protein
MDKTRKERLDEQNRLIARQEQIAAILHTYPNVAGTAVGVKEVGGKLTDEIVIRVYVYDKKPLENLRPDEVIPAEIDGIKIDVNKMPTELSGCGDANEYRPMIGGSQIIGAKANGSGTVGCFAIDNVDSSIVLLTNYHVLMDNGEQPGHAAAQPDFCCDDFCCRCGEVAKLVRGADFANPNEFLDCAIAKLSNGQENNYVNEVLEIGPLNGITPTLVAGDHVFKRGKATRRTEGIVNAVRIAVLSPVTFESGVKNFRNHMTITPANPALPFSHKGDSGSVIVDAQNRVVGLLFGDNSKEDPYRAATITLANHITDVVAKLNITIPEVGTPNAIPLRSEGNTIRIAEAEPARLQKLIENQENGKLLINLFYQHSKEIMYLIRNNRDVKVAWNRFKGPAFTAHLVEKSRKPEYILPVEIEGYTAMQLLLKMSTVLEKHGSIALAGDIETHGTEVIRLFQKISKEQLAVIN